MKTTTLWRMMALLTVLALILTACAPAATPVPPTEAPPAETEAAPAETEAPAAEKVIMGMLFVGPYNDHGYSQAHYEGGLFVQENDPNVEMIYIDKVNSADRPGTTPAQLADDLVSKGAKVIVFNSDDMKDSAVEFATANPDTYVIHASGDSAWADGKDFKDLPNLTNVFGRMEYGKMMAGCAAALSTQTGQIGYLGPLINDETRRLASAAFLGARHCWETYLQKDPADLQFKVTWIGFWFNIPGVTSDPTQVADEFINSGFDVIISGIDTTEGLQEAKKFSESGKQVWAIPYDYVGACTEAPEVCLGVPYFNWGPLYLEQMQAFQAGTHTPVWDWRGPDWADINNPDTSTVGFVKGDALSAEAAANLDKFIAELAGGLNLFTGPLNFQDGSAYLADGAVATDLEVWYLPQLLEGMEGQSVPSN